jgi:hypothetical protein
MSELARIVTAVTSCLHMGVPGRSGYLDDPLESSIDRGRHREAR